MQHVHAEAEHVARLEVGGQPAVAEVALHHRRVGVEPGEPVVISVGGEVAGMESFGPMAVLEENQCSFVAVDATQRDPTREKMRLVPRFMYGPSQWNPQPSPGRTKRGHLMSKLRTSPSRRAVWMLRTSGASVTAKVPRAGPDALGERSKVGRSNSCAVSGNRIVDRVTVVDLAEDRVLLQDLVTGGEHNVGLQESSEEQVPTLVHLLAKCCRVGEEVIRRLELAEAGRCGVERVPVGSQHRWTRTSGRRASGRRGSHTVATSATNVKLVRTPRTLADLVDRARLVSIGVPLYVPAVTDGTTAWSWAEYADRVGSHRRSARRRRGATGRHGRHPRDQVGARIRVRRRGVASRAVVVPVDPLAPVDLAVSVLRDAGIEVLVSDVEAGDPRAVGRAARAEGRAAPTGELITSVFQRRRGDGARRRCDRDRAAGRSSRRRRGRSGVHHLHIRLDRPAQGHRPHTPKRVGACRRRGRRVRPGHRRPHGQHRPVALRPVDVRALLGAPRRRRRARRPRPGASLPGERRGDGRSRTGDRLVLGSAPAHPDGRAGSVGGEGPVVTPVDPVRWRSVPTGSTCRADARDPVRAGVERLRTRRGQPVHAVPPRNDPPQDDAPVPIGRAGRSNAPSGRRR